MGRAIVDRHYVFVSMKHEGYLMVLRSVSTSILSGNSHLLHVGFQIKSELLFPVGITTCGQTAAISS